MEITTTKTASLQKNWLQDIKQQLNQNLIPIFTLATIISGGLITITAWKTISIYLNYSQSLEKKLQLNQLSDQLMYFDEALTMSARMAASSGDVTWQKRYQDFIPKVGQTIQGILDIAPQYKPLIARSDEANAKLIEMEKQAFKWIRENRPSLALGLLLGPVYGQQKDLYSEGINQTVKDIKKGLQRDITQSKQQLVQSAILSGISIPIIVLTWIGVLSLLRSYIRERDEAQAATNELNRDLEQKVMQRTQELAEKEETTRKQSEILQEDVANILEVVSAMESGDLTVNAPVSEGVTGLVSDTFNRLTEELSEILFQVLQASSQVSHNSLNLEQAAENVTRNAEQQAKSVSQLLQLAEQIKTAAIDSAKQIKTSINSIDVTRVAVDKGQSAITILTDSIDELSENTNKIIQQMKTLGEFVGQTDQFVQEQSQIASLTQVLAMNASLVAARASEQRDPSQFVVVAREFEAIANQVSALALRTNEGLGRLEQRSTQIHNVVSTVDAKVQNLGELVREFTEGVEKSGTVFGNIQNVTKDAVESGAVVEKSNQIIVNASTAMAELMAEIASLAAKTLTLSQSATNQSQQLESLSRKLLKNVEFFQLPQLASAGELPPAVEVKAHLTNPN